VSQLTMMTIVVTVAMTLTVLRTIVNGGMRVYEMIFVLFRKQDSTTSCSHLLPILHQFISVLHLTLTSTRLVGLV